MIYILRWESEGSEKMINILILASFGELCMYLYKHIPRDNHLNKLNYNLGQFQSKILHFTNVKVIQ